MGAISSEPRVEPAVTDYELARQRVEKRRKLRSDVAAYVVINVFLVITWAVTGFGYFWPGWVLAGWGVLLALSAWDTRYRQPVTHADIDAELHRHR